MTAGAHWRRHVGAGVLSAAAVVCCSPTPASAPDAEDTAVAPPLALHPPATGRWAVDVATTHTRHGDEVSTQVQGTLVAVLDASFGGTTRLHVTAPDRDERWTITASGGTIESMGAPVRAWVQPTAASPAPWDEGTIRYAITPGDAGCAVLEASWTQRAEGAPAAWSEWHVEERRTWCSPGVETELRLRRWTDAGATESSWRVAR